MSARSNTTQKSISVNERVTIRDVARLASVSTATVSKVLNDTPYVREETRARVLDAVRKLKYQPNSIARSLKMRRTRTIALVTNSLDGVFTIPMMRGVEAAASKHGFSVFLCNSYGNQDREQEHLEALLAKQVDGVIFMSGDHVEKRHPPALPLQGVANVYLYQYVDSPTTHCVVPDDYGGAYDGTLHLIHEGYRRIALVGGPQELEAVQKRSEGYSAALRDSHIPYDSSLVRFGPWRMEHGYNSVHELCRAPSPPDAFFCGSDVIAAGALDALHELGLRVPDDVAVVGFDDRFFAAQQRPPLTTVALPFADMGKLAGELLIEIIMDEPQVPAIHKVPCQLVHRQSCRKKREP